MPIFRSTNKFRSDISVLIQCSFSALTVLIEFGRYVWLFRVLVHSIIFSHFNGWAICFQKIVSHLNRHLLTKNLHPLDSRSCYPAVNGLYVHKLLCLSVCLLSNGTGKVTQPLELTHIRSLLYRLKRKI